MHEAPSPSDDILPGFAILIITVIVALFATRNLPWHLDDLDQAKQAYVSYQMIEDGKWIMQEMPDSSVSDKPHVATKPPLQGWMSAAIYLGLGAHGWEVAWRLPAFLAALVILRGLWRAGDEIFGNNIGSILAIGMFGLNSYTPRLAALVRTDMLLTAFIFFTGLLIVNKLQTGKPWTFRERLFTFLLLLGSTLTKGPIAYGFLLPGIIAFRLFTLKRDLPRHVWAGWLAWLLPLVVFGAWVVYGCRTMPGFYEQVVVKEFAGRFTVGETAVHHNMPPGTYALGLLARTLPWTALLVAMFLVKPVRAAFRRDAVLTWLVCWALGGLIFMECVPSKRFDRILPVLPPLCLLLVAAARHLPHFKLGKEPIGRLTILVSLLAVPIAAGYSIWKTVESFRDDNRVLVNFGQKTREAVGRQRDRLLVAEAKDEGLFMYAGAQQFTRLKDALGAWRFQRIDWLVVGADDLEKHRTALEPYEVIASTPLVPEKTFSTYRLIHRPKVASAGAPAGPAPSKANGSFVIPPIPEQPTSPPSADGPAPVPR